MPYTLEDKLVVAISSRALFALEEADAVYRAQGLDAYREYQRAREDEPLHPGTAFPLVRGLLRLNSLAEKTLVEVIIVSRNDADSGLRIMKSAEALGLDITRAAFTDGADPWPYLKPLACNLFLSTEHDAVREAVDIGFPAARVLDPPAAIDSEDVGPVKIAFDGDAVLFDGESERVFQEQGMEAFMARERELADVPMNPGPFEPFLKALARVQPEFTEETSPIRTALVTSRNAPAHERAVKTLRAWGVRVDESFFLGGVEKAGILDVLKPHIFFDDQPTHLESARATTPSALVPWKGEQGQLFEPSTSEAEVPESPSLTQRQKQDEPTEPESRAAS